MDVTKDPDYSSAYNKLPVESPGDTEMAEERRFFMSHVDDLMMQMTVYQNKVLHCKNIFVMDSDWVVSSVVKVLDDKLDHVSYERLNSRLQLHEQLVMEHLANKAEIRQQLYLLKFISYMTPFLIGMKKRMKIPDLSRLLPNLTGKLSFLTHLLMSVKLNVQQTTFSSFWAVLALYLLAVTFAVCQ